MGYVKSYKDLIVWQKGMELVKEVFVLTDKFPRSEVFGITSQMRRAAVAIQSNIAEGYGRKSLAYNHQFFSIAYGSALELETQTIISKDLKLVPLNSFEKTESILLEVCKMLNKMTGKVELVTSN